LNSGGAGFYWRGRYPPPTLVIFAEAGGADLEEAVEETYFPSQGPESFPKGEYEKKQSKADVQ